MSYQDHKEVSLQSDTSGTIKASLSMKVEREDCKLTLTANDSTMISATESNFYTALQTIRLDLENRGYFILCQGACKNVRPSGMALSMSDGLKAYKLVLGKRPLLNDLVDIFEPATREEVSTVAEQNAFFEAWIKTPKS